MRVDDVTAERDEWKRRYEECSAVLADIREERGLKQFREWLREQWVDCVERMPDNLLAGKIGADVVSTIVAEFDRRFGVHNPSPSRVTKEEP